MWFGVDRLRRILPEVCHVDGQSEFQSSHSMAKKCRSRPRYFRNLLVITVRRERLGSVVTGRVALEG